MTELKPCPFCGGKVNRFIGPLRKTVMIVCETCGADVCFYGAEHEPKATKAWNRRAKVEAEPVKHGRWKCESDLETYTIWRCSECGMGFEHTSPYCRNCGAKMGGEEA